MTTWKNSLTVEDLALTAGPFLMLVIGYGLLHRSAVQASKNYETLLPLYYELAYIETQYAPWRKIAEQATAFGSEEARYSHQWETWYSDFGVWTPHYGRQVQLIEWCFDGGRFSSRDLTPEEIADVDSVLPLLYPDFRKQYRGAMLNFRKSRLQIDAALPLLERKLAVLISKGALVVLR